MQPSNNNSFAYATRSQAESVSNNNSDLLQNVNIPFDFRKAALPGSRPEPTLSGSFAASATPYALQPNAYRMPQATTTNTNSTSMSNSFAGVTPLAPPVALSAMSMPSSTVSYPVMWNEATRLPVMQQPQQSMMMMPPNTMPYTQTPQQQQPMGNMRMFQPMTDNGAMGYTGSPVPNTSYMTQPNANAAPSVTMAQYMSTSGIESGRPSEADNRAWYSAMSSPRSSLNIVDQAQQPQYVMTPELWPGLVSGSTTHTRLANTATTTTTNNDNSSNTQTHTLSPSDLSLLRQVNQSSAFIQRYLTEGTEVSTEARQHIAALLERVRSACEQTMQAERDVGAAEEYFYKMAAVEEEFMQLVQSTQARMAAANATSSSSSDAAANVVNEETNRSGQAQQSTSRLPSLQNNSSHATPAPPQHSETQYQMTGRNELTSTQPGQGSGMQRIASDLAECAALTNKLEQLEIALRVLEDQHDALQKRYLLDTPPDKANHTNATHTTTTTTSSNNAETPDEAAAALLASHRLQARQRAVRERLLDELLLQRREEATCHGGPTRDTLLLVYVPIVAAAVVNDAQRAQATSSPNPSNPAEPQAESVQHTNSNNGVIVSRPLSPVAVTPVIASPTRYAEVQLATWLTERLQFMAGRLVQVVQGRETQLQSYTNEVNSLDAYDPAREFALRRREQAMQELNGLHSALTEVAQMQQRAQAAQRTMYDALRNQAMLRRCLLEALAQRLDEEERHRHSASSAPSVRTTAVPETETNNTTNSNLIHRAGSSHEEEEEGRMNIAAQTYHMNSTGEHVLSRVGSVMSSAGAGAAWRFSELTSNPTNSTRTSTVLPPYAALPRASDVFRAMLEQIAASHAQPAPLHPILPQQQSVEEGNSTIASEQMTSNNAGQIVPDAEAATVEAVAPETQEQQPQQPSAVDAEQSSVTQEVVTQQEVQIPETITHEACYSCVEQENTSSVAERLNEASEVTRAEANVPLHEEVNEKEEERRKKVTHSESGRSSSEGGGEKEEDDDGAALRSDDEGAQGQDEDEEEEYSLRNGTLLRGITALVKAVVKRAVTFSDDEDVDEEETRELARRGRKRVRRE